MLPQRPPTPIIQVTSPRSSPLPYAPPPPIAPPTNDVSSQSEFDPTVFREQVLRRAALSRHYLRQLRNSVDYSIILGKSGSQRLETPPSASISVELPGRIASRLFGIPSSARSPWRRGCLAVYPPSLDGCSAPRKELGCVFGTMIVATVIIFLVMTCVYLWGFVFVR